LAPRAPPGAWAPPPLGLRRGAVLYSNDPYGRALRAAFLRDFARLDGEIVAVDPYLAEAPEVGPYLDRAARGASRPEFFLLAGSRDEAEALLRQLRERRLRLPVLGPSGFEGVEAVGPLAESTYVATAYLPGVASPANRRFLAAWRRAHPSAGPPNQSAAATYDALHLLRDVVERVGAERAAVRRGLAEVGSVAPAFEGASGTIAFDAAGDVPSARVYIGVARGGALVPAEGS
jgi:ABC-type branched-subunit amino acid transport system substrate-binding protein